MWTSTKIIFDLTRFWVVMLFSYSNSSNVSSTGSRVQQIAQPAHAQWTICTFELAMQFKLLYTMQSRWQIQVPCFEKNLCWKFRAKNFHVQIFLWVWKTIKIKHATIFEHRKIIKIIIANVCLQSCTFQENPRSTRCNRFIICVDELVYVVSEHEGFCSRYNNNHYAVGIYTGNHITSRARASHMRWQLSWPTAVPCDLKAYFSVRITSYWHYLLPLCSKATCNVTITFCCLIIYAAKNFWCL